MSKPRILIIENSIDVTGALKSITRTSYDLKSFFDFQFIIPSKSRGKFWIEGRGFNTIHELPLKEISKRFSSLILYLPYLVINTIRLKKIIRRNSISIVHVNDLYNLLPVMLHLTGTKIPYVCHIRFLPDRFPRWLFSLWLQLHLRYASKVIAVSQHVLNLLPKHQKLMLIHNELPIEENYQELVKPETTNPTQTFLYLSNFIKGKGQDFAIEAFAQIHHQIPNWKIRFVGGDMGLQKNMEFKSQLMNRAKALGIFEKTEWFGFTEDVERAYKHAEIVLNFSESESFSITCVEALFFGRPVIATNSGGPAEIIENDKTGYLVNNRNVYEMGEAMLQIANDKRKRLEMGVLARISVRERFSIENTSYRIKAAYNMILD